MNRAGVECSYKLLNCFSQDLKTEYAFEEEGSAKVTPVTLGSNNETVAQVVRFGENQIYAGKTLMSHMIVRGEYRIETHLSPKGSYQRIYHNTIRVSSWDLELALYAAHFDVESANLTYIYDSPFGSFAFAIDLTP